jgi:hypothetical protein
VIEHLGLMGTGSTGTNVGIKNCCAQEHSLVSDVLIANVATGIALSDSYAENSGPYSNITMSNVNKCVSIEQGSTGKPIPVTRGFHGLTCTLSSTSNSSAAILIDGSDNSLGGHQHY